VSLEWIRRTYTVPAKRGTRVEVPFSRWAGAPARSRVVHERRTGRIAGGSRYLFVRLDAGPKDPYPYHPRWNVVYFAADGSVALDTRAAPPERGEPDAQAE
jgi:hypothetical protein